MGALGPPGFVGGRLMARIGIDLDGVLYPFVDVIHDRAQLRLGHKLPRNFEKWGFFEDWGLDWPGFVALMERECEAGFLYWKGAIAPGAVENIFMLEEWGQEVVYVTARGAHAHDATASWLRQHALDHRKLITGASDKTLHQLDVLLDDGPHNIEAAIAAGCRGIIFDQPWNQGIEGERVHSWDEFGQLMAETL